MRATCVLVAVLGLFIALPEAASAHPLGNYTVNHFTRVAIAPDQARLNYVVDMAEIPTVGERQRIDTNDDGDLAAAETDAYLAEVVPQLMSGLELTIDGAGVRLRQAGTARLGFAQGQAGLPTLRLELDLVADLPNGSHAAIVTGAFTDGTFADRIGWREIIVVGSDATILESSVPAASISNELRSYPGDGLDSPIDVQAATFQARLISGTVPEPPTPAAAGAAPARNDDPLAGLLVQGGSSAGGALLAVLISLGLGAAHAASPGHGKTLVAAYLIGTGGTPGQAVTLGLTVAITHTVGVFILGGVVLAASELIVPERVVEWLAMAAGVIVVGMGVVLTARALLGTHDHGRPHQHPHTHSDALSHRHGDEPAPAHHLRPSPVSGRSVAMIGLAGGMVPSASALIVLLVAVSQGQLTLGVALIGAFGVGMAMALAMIGLGVVLARRRVERGGFAALAHPALLRLGRTMPVASALVVLAVGILLTLEAIGRIA